MQDFRSILLFFILLNQGLSEINSDLSTKLAGNLTVLGRFTSTDALTLSDDIDNYKFLFCHLYVNGVGVVGEGIISVAHFKTLNDSANRYLLARYFDRLFECDFYYTSNTSIYCTHYTNISQCTIYGMN